MRVGTGGSTQDELNGHLAQETVSTVARLFLVAGGDCSFLPGIVLRALAQPGTRERAKQRLFQPPKTTAQMICRIVAAPCDASWMDKLFAFVCHRGTPWKCRNLPFSELTLASIRRLPIFDESLSAPASIVFDEDHAIEVAYEQRRSRK